MLGLGRCLLHLLHTLTLFALCPSLPICEGPVISLPPVALCTLDSDFLILRAQRKILPRVLARGKILPRALARGKVLPRALLFSHASPSLRKQGLILARGSKT